MFLVTGCLRVRRQIQNLIDALFERDQIPSNQLIASPAQFMGVANLEKLRQPLVRVKANSIPIGNGNKHKIEELLQAG